MTFKAIKARLHCTKSLCELLAQGQALASVALLNNLRRFMSSQMLVISSFLHRQKLHTLAAAPSLREGPGQSRHDQLARGLC